jgi:ankyrin repeat protein
MNEIRAVIDRAYSGQVDWVMLKPDELETEEGRDIWATLVAASQGDIDSLHRLIDKNPVLSRAEFWYSPAIHFAVREGHIDAVRLLLDAGADPESNGLYDGSLIVMAKDRGHEAIAALLERERDRRRRPIAGQARLPIHTALAKGDLKNVSAELDADPSLIHAIDRDGCTPLHRALLGHAPQHVITLLLDRGADLHTRRGSGSGFWSDLEPIDLALWGNGWEPRKPEIARLLLSRGASYDLAIACALGDIDQVRQMLDAVPERIYETRPSGRRPLSAAIEMGHYEIARLLLERGVDPKWDEPSAPKGRALHSAARAGELWLVELLLAHGADPNSDIDSSGNAFFAAATPEIKQLLVSHGATHDPYDNSWLEDEHSDVRLLAEGPQSASRLGAAFTMIVGSDRDDLLSKLLTAGLRIPSIVTGCQGYLLHNAGMLRTLLEHGMNPNLMNWQHQTLLHLVCHGPNSTGSDVERAAMLLDAGADINAREEEYRSTPLGWAARRNARHMVEFLLSRGASTNLPDDEPWATPLAWAERRGHSEVGDILRRSGAL